MTTEEIVQINTIRFRDKDNNPTCASDFTTNKYCIFYRTYRLGLGETCAFCSDDDPDLKRRNGGTGTLIPIKECPIWRTKVGEHS